MLTSLRDRSASYIDTAAAVLNYSTTLHEPERKQLLEVFPKTHYRTRLLPDPIAQVDASAAVELQDELTATCERTSHRWWTRLAIPWSRRSGPPRPIAE